MSITANWSYPTAIRFGAGRISEIAEACAAAGIKKPLLVTDRGLAKMDITTKTLDLLEASGLGRAIFAEVDPNPNEKNALAGVKAFRDGGHDGVVAFGGGSGLDLGKMIALMHDQNLSVFELEDIGDWWTRADASKIAPIIAVPTTAPFGPFVSKNHFAGWTEMAALLTAGLALGLADEARRRGRDWTADARAGGVILIGLGCKILAEHTGYL